MFITFEGIEGCGKSTQAKHLYEYLIGLDIPAIHTLEPGDTSIGILIRRILLDTQNKNLSPLAELLLYAADRAQHVGEIIVPAMKQGKWIICDRFFDATTVYQGVGRGQDLELIHTLNEKAAQGLVPDITFLLDCPVDIGVGRALKRNQSHLHEDQDRFEKEKKEFHQAVRDGYLALAKENPKRFIVLDGTTEESHLAKMIIQQINPYLTEEER